MAVSCETAPTVLSSLAGFPLHLLGWKSFQDLSVAVAEECLRRPVQSFLPNNDAGRDGAFVGRWDSDDMAAGESTIQCKFTSKLDLNLSLSMLSDELDKARTLAARGLADDYIILTNHPITGSSELEIKSAFEGVGVGRCRVFGYDFLVRQIHSSPKLRMMAPRLYGLGNLSDILDARAYQQAQIILSAMGEDLQRLVVTDAHRKSVRAISEHNLVLLLGGPATGKSTIGASIAIGAADIWQSGTIRATSPEDIQRHLNPDAAQFFWIDDAWGSTQYQRYMAEAWNQVFPLMQAAIKRGTRFLITSRDYIWNSARQDLKIQAIPVLGKSQVVINVQELSTQEKAQILYNHLKLGDQSVSFRKEVKPFLPEIAERRDFLPESARRLGSRFFASNVTPARENLIAFFEKPQKFLLETITNLSPASRAAIAVVFLNGGKIRSPIDSNELLPAAEAIGVETSSLREQLVALNGSLLLLATDEEGQYWTYKHPTVSDAFAAHVASNPELIEIYLKGAKLDSIVSEVICAGRTVYGASVIVPDSLHGLLEERLSSAPANRLVRFLSYRANKVFCSRMIERRPDVFEGMETFGYPIKDDSDAVLAAFLFEQELLPEEIRTNFVALATKGAIEAADSSILDDSSFEKMLTSEEKAALFSVVKANVLNNLKSHIERLCSDWSNDYSPDDYFDSFRDSIHTFASAILPQLEYDDILETLDSDVGNAISKLNERYEPYSSTSAPTSSSVPRNAVLANLFRDVDE